MKTTLTAFFLGLTAIGLATTLFLPSHDTPAAINLAGKVTTGVLGRIMGKGN